MTQISLRKRRSFCLNLTSFNVQLLGILLQEPGPSKHQQCLCIRDERRHRYGRQSTDLHGKCFHCWICCQSAPRRDSGHSSSPKFAGSNFGGIMGNTHVLLLCRHLGPTTLRFTFSHRVVRRSVLSLYYLHHWILVHETRASQASYFILLNSNDVWDVQRLSSSCSI